MIKKIAWNTFKQTGDIKTYLELKQFERVSNNFKDDFDLLGTGTEGMFLNGMSLQEQENIEKAVNNFWNNINKE